MLRGRLITALDHLLMPVKRPTGNERLAAFLEQHPDEVFRFLTHPETISATNNDSEFQLRFCGIACKLSGSNRTTAGSVAQMTLPSLTRTCRKLAREPYEFLQALCSPPHPTLPSPWGVKCYVALPSSPLSKTTGSLRQARREGAGGRGWRLEHDDRYLGWTAEGRAG